jgi:hypothetical protein
VNKVTITIEGELQSALRIDSEFQAEQHFGNALSIIAHIVEMSATGKKPTGSPAVFPLRESEELFFPSESLLKTLHETYDQSDSIEVKIFREENLQMVGFTMTFYTTGGVEKLLVLKGKVDGDYVREFEIE